MMGGPARAPPARPASNLKAPVQPQQQEEADQKQAPQTQIVEQSETTDGTQVVEEETVKPSQSVEETDEKEDRPMQIPVKRQPQPKMTMEARMKQAQINDTTLTEADQSKVMLQFDDSIIENNEPEQIAPV